MRILIAEDDAALAKFVSQGLEGEHHTVEVIPDGEQARAAVDERDYDIVVLDLNLPKLDGVCVLRHLRSKKPSLPVLVLTQRTRVEDRVQCLDAGADDYLPKPFAFSELSARIRALARRSHLPSASVLTIEDLKLDRVERRVERAGRRIELTAKEFALLEYLMLNAGHQVTRSMIIEHVWNLAFDTTTNVVDVYINYSGIVFNVGNATSNATAEQNASSLVLQQLNDQRSAISGVSLDQEAANLVRYQQAYSASAQVISTISSMMQTVINMVSS
jgi:DNA-binding response OmpR family regulator